MVKTGVKNQRKTGLKCAGIKKGSAFRDCSAQE